MENAPEQVLVMPVHNERDSIREVISRKDACLASLRKDYRIRVFNDGSVDGTARILDELCSFIFASGDRSFYARGVFDTKSPHLQMRTSQFSTLFEPAPADTFAPNIVVAGFACLRKLRIFETHVAYP